jgi:hypothetical protein
VVVEGVVFMLPNAMIRTSPPPHNTEWVPAIHDGDQQYTAVSLPVVESEFTA